MATKSKGRERTERWCKCERLATIMVEELKIQRYFINVTDLETDENISLLPLQM